MNIWAIGKDGKPLTVTQIRAISRDFPSAISDNEVVCCKSKSLIQEWISGWFLAGCEPVKIWSGR